jgi:hypothetical protein
MHCAGPKIVRSKVSYLQLVCTYWFDYVVLLLLLVVFVGTSFIHPYERYIYDIELTHWLAYPSNNDTIPSWTVPVSPFCSLVIFEVGFWSSIMFCL